MTVLIITHSEDNESPELVAEAVKRRGERAVRFDTDRYPTEVRLSARIDEGGESLTLVTDRGALDLGEVTALWHRRVSVGKLIPQTLDPQLRSASVGEARASLFGVLASLRAFRVDPVHLIRRAENKQLQLQAAREFGLEVPRTLTSNDPDAVRRFADSCPGGLISKMLSSFAVYDEGREMVVFTNPVTEKDLQDLSGLSLCPMTFQERVEKRLELRVTVVGRRVMAASIDSQASDRAQHDWRRDGLRMIDDWQHYQLPSEVEAKLLRLMDYFQLNYGAADFILTPEGRHVFLEVNPSGEFFWLEQRPGLPVSEALADVLLGLAPRRE
ncbi:MAG TPA: MvdD family ATP-grasp ribosomal peptide maturase [Pyrinomonadaceae bacterium]|nr:MvdD family ATP-grasp ribosomal peptide maturase [Pyrinomonadaceae bacterium]